MVPFSVLVIVFSLSCYLATLLYQNSGYIGLICTKRKTLFTLAKFWKLHHITAQEAPSVHVKFYQNSSKVHQNVIVNN